METDLLRQQLNVPEDHPNAGKLIFIPKGAKVGEIVKKHFLTTGILDEHGELADPLEIRVFNKKYTELLLGGAWTHQII